MRIWPERLQNPHQRGGTGRTEGWQYRVLSVDPSSDRLTLQMRSGRERLWLLFDRWHNLLEVRRLLLVAGGGSWKTELIQDNPTGGRVFFQPVESSPPPVLWFHPYLTGTSLGTSRRFNFVVSSEPTGDWVYQRVERGSGGLHFHLYHEPSSSRVVIDWPAGRPWWKTMEWYHQQRLVGLARTKYGVLDLEGDPAIRPLE